MRETILIRWLVPADVPAIRRLSRCGVRGRAAWSCKELRAFLRRGLNNGLVAETNGKVVGCLLYTIDLPQAILGIVYLTVAPRWRRRGLGAHLLRDLFG